MNPIIDDIETNTCACACDNTCPAKKVGACICTDCKCHLRRKNREIHLHDAMIPSARMQYVSYGFLTATVCFVGLYMLVLRP